MDEKLDAVWQKILPHVPDDDPLKGDVDEYLDAGEYGIACEAIAILAKRYGQYESIIPELEPLMVELILADDEEV